MINEYKKKFANTSYWNPAFDNASTIEELDLSPKEMCVVSFLKGIEYMSKNCDLSLIENGKLLTECMKRKIYIQERKAPEEKKLSIDDFPGLKSIKEELLKRGYRKVEKD